MIRLFRSRIYISIFALLLVPMLALSHDALFLCIALSGALFHEFAHITAMMIFGASIIRISVYPCGADIRADTSRLSYKSEIAVFLSGPLASLVLCVTAFVFYGFMHGAYILFFAVSNLMFFFVNILPVTGLDGGRALEVLLYTKYDLSFAQKVCDTLSTIAFALLCILALLMLFLSGYNISLVFICAYLFLSGFVKQKMRA
ncbi:MAG: hypothetical protein E7583_00540 [Ruminococcaceae bacterium]|nr:hypothetical protein [Oscillospiraceae bacterium]